MGSITKSFTGVVIMQLVQEGKLSLDDTIDTWFPDQPNAGKITVRMLLSHTSGLANFISVENAMDPKWAHAWAPLDLVAEANRLGPVDEPGSDRPLCQHQLHPVGLIVEKLTGNSWKQAVRSRIIEPLHLEHTAFLSDEGVWGGSMVPGYVKTANGYTSTLELPSYPHVSTSWAAGEVVSSPADLLTFASALFDGGLVSKETLAEMATPLGTDAENGRRLGPRRRNGRTGTGRLRHGRRHSGLLRLLHGYSGHQARGGDAGQQRGGRVIGPSMMALEYLRSAPPAGQAPAR